MVMISRCRTRQFTGSQCCPFRVSRVSVAQSVHIPSRTAMTSTPPLVNPHPHLMLADRLNQLQHTLSLITSERDSLCVSLKTAGQDAQKADAALRSEIEILKCVREASRRRALRAAEGARPTTDGETRADVDEVDGGRGRAPCPPAPARGEVGHGL
ncbi:hypothetical protein K438DRAFT_528423 [Mycena galopus ATCC 62051]|nr:hypothetical protein K438DRAFT_528423 [Mycena galopus ATCC 62051]